MKIRAYAEGDESGVCRVWHACQLIIPHNDPIKDIRRKLRVNPEWFLIGEIDGEIAATCMAGYEGHRGWINYLAVLPGFQRCGIGTKIMMEAERLLSEADCPKINLQIRATNLAVIEFYKRLGYSVDSVTSMGKRLEADIPPPAGNQSPRVPKREPIKGERVDLVPCDSSRIGEIHEAVMESVPEISPWMGWCHPSYTIEEARQWMCAQPMAWASGLSFEFMVVDSQTGRLIGACGINQINRANRFANLGYWIRTSCRRRGFAPEAARLAADFGFRELNLARIEIVAAVGNGASQRVAEKAGAVREAQLRNRLIVREEIQDAVMFALISRQS